MKTKTGLIAAALALGLAAPMMGATAAYAQCTHGERIDGSTADTARAQIQRAGFSNVAGLTKGCDNYWHGTATQNGRAVGVVLAPSGQVMIESALDQPPGMSGGTSYTVDRYTPPPADTRPVYPQTASPGYPERTTPEPRRIYNEPQRTYPDSQRAVPSYPSPLYPRN
jgi:hypothetical protein